MSSGAVISIHSVHAESIYAGRKRFEYRTRKPAQRIDYLALYETGETRAVTGIAKVNGIIEGIPSEIWDLTKPFAGISSKFFKQYFSGRKKAVAYCLGEAMAFDEVIRLEDIGINRAPQSFQYIGDDAIDMLLEQEVSRQTNSCSRYFVGGIHGVGKTTFVTKVADMMGVPSYSSSDLIKSFTVMDWADKVVSNDCVNANQDALIQALGATSWDSAGGFLDGHFVLRTGEGLWEEIPVDVFRDMRLDGVFVLTAKPEAIAGRLAQKDSYDCARLMWNLPEIESLQSAELAHAQRVANNLHLPLSIIKAG